MAAIGTIGDIIHVIELASEVVSTLKDVSHASHEYIALINDVETIHLALRVIESKLSRDANINEALGLGLTIAIARCGNIFSEMNTTIQNYKALGPTVSPVSRFLTPQTV